MDEVSQEPSAMIAELARRMMQDRREKFLDAACGSDRELRAAVEARLGHCDHGEGEALDRDSAGYQAGGCREADAFESLALKALSTTHYPEQEDHPALDNEGPDNGPIETYCDQKGLDLIARLRLFQRVCRKIDETHRHGSIHGALTPECIRVGPDDEPSVIEQDLAAMDPAVLRYTSPEQILGESITTATDVYCLGILLYELLTGRYPYHTFTLNPPPDELYAVISEQAPERPSLAVIRPVPAPRSPETIAEARQASPARLAWLVSGDLELIVLHALHKEPERRYTSALQLADDIECYIQRRPVLAHRASWRYRAGKFIQRHPVLSTVGLVLAAAILSALPALTISLARARRDQNHAEISYQTARSAMEGIFAQISERHEWDVPGLQPARVALLETALHFYESVSERHGADLESRMESAEAQKRVGRINRLIGLPDVAVWQYQEALNRFEELAADDAGNSHFSDDLAEILTELGEIVSPMEGRRAEARHYLERADHLLRAEVLKQPKSAPIQRELARVVSDMAQLEHVEDHLDQARALWKQAIDMLDVLASEHPGNLDDTISLASAQVGLARVLAANPITLDKVVQTFTRGINLRQAVTRKYPDRVDQIHHLALDQNELAGFYQASGQFESAFEQWKQATTLFEQLDRRFPDTVPYQTGLYLTYDSLSRLRNQQGGTAEALRWSEEARAVLERLVAQHPKDPTFQIDLSRSHSFIGRLLQHSGKHVEALHSFQRTVDILESLPELDPANSYQLALNLAVCVSLIGAGSDATAPEDESKLSPADRLRRQVYGTRAVTALRRAVTGGFLKLEALQAESDFESLRDRPDFQKLLGELTEKGK